MSKVTSLGVMHFIVSCFAVELSWWGLCPHLAAAANRIGLSPWFLVEVASVTTYASVCSASATTYASVTTCFEAVLDNSGGRHYAGLDIKYILDVRS